MRIDNSPETPSFRRIFRSDGPRWLASFGAALFTGIWVFDTTAGAAQRVARLMDMARPACIHSGITNEELHEVVTHALVGGSSKKDALRAVVTLCQTKLRVG
jgi:hypothetical protein